MKKFLTIMIVALITATCVFALPVKFAGGSVGYAKSAETNSISFDLSADVCLSTIEENVTFDAYGETGLIFPFGKFNESNVKWNTFVGVGPTYTSKDGKLTVTTVLGTGVSVFNGFTWGFGAEGVVRYIIKDNFGAYAEVGRFDAINTHVGTWNAKVGIFHTL